MLDILRKHAASFMIKIILGMIIVSFVFFYGWSRIQKANKIGGATGDVVAKIDGENVSSNEYGFFYQQTAERVEKQFQVKDKSSLEEMIKSTALNQTIRRHMLYSMAKNAGFVISDQELALFIKNQFVSEDGNFDKNFYLYRYLPYFKNRYGIDYEFLAKQDLTIESFQQGFDFLNVPVLSAENKEKEWNFIVVEFDPNKDTKDNIKTIDDAKSAAVKLLSEKNISSWSKLAKKHNATLNHKKGIRISTRESIFNSNVDDETYKNIFSLNEKNAKIQKPEVVGNKVFIIALEDIKEIDSKPTFRPFVDSWLEAKLQDSKVKIYLK